MCRAHSDQGVRGAEARDAPTAANVSSGATIGRARLNPSGSTPGRLFGERGSILCNQSEFGGRESSRFLGTKRWKKPETESIIARTTERMEGPKPCFGPTQPKLLAPI